MAAPSPELIQPQSELPSETLAVLGENETTGLRFLADNPNLNILIHFSTHENADDLGDDSYFEVPLGKADVYAHENHGYQQAESQFVLDAFSKRLFPPELLPQVLAHAGDSFNDRKLTAVYNTGTPAISADVVSDHWLVKLAPSIKQLAVSIEAIYAGELQGVNEAMAEPLIEIVADRQKAREWVILADLGSKLAKLALRDETIGDKLQSGNLNIFMTYGSVHTGLFHKLRQLGLQPERTFPTKPYIYPPALSLLRKKMFAKAPSD
jgi:hypothetical protein